MSPYDHMMSYSGAAMHFDEDYATPDSYAPDQYDDNADQQRDDFAAAVDAGKTCPECYGDRNIRAERALGLPVFICGDCNTTWFDFYTRPARDAWLPVQA